METNLEKELISNTRLYEYMSASNPLLNKIPVLVHSCELYLHGPSRIIPFDISEQLNIPHSCTSPNLLASFIRIIEHDTLECVSQATSNVFYIINGFGKCHIPDHGVINYGEGDIIVIPENYNSKEKIKFTSTINTYIYWINDEPLLKYLNVIPNGKNFPPALYKKDTLYSKVEEISHNNSEHKNRLGVLLGNKVTDHQSNYGSGTLTLTPTMWSLLNVLPEKSFQKPHRHNSVALDLCVSGGGNNVYTLMGPELDSSGNVKNPIRCNWENGSVFITPPGWWHSHHNDSDTKAYVLPIQDAGLYTYQRTLNIEFS